MAQRDDNASAVANSPGTNYPTQLSIAKEAGLSRTTVADILSKKRLERYNAETQRKVFEVAKRLNYRPHRSAQEVRRGRSNLIGVLHSSGTTQTASERALYLGRAISRSGFELFLNDGLWCEGGVESSVGQMLSARVEGVIISGPLQSGPKHGEEVIKALQASNIPIVSVSTYNSSPLALEAAIEADFTQGFRELTEHLIRGGKRRLIIETSLSYRAGQIRYEGFRQAILACGGVLHSPLNAGNYRNPWLGNGAVEGVLVDEAQDAQAARHDPCGQGTIFLERLLERDMEADAIMASNDYHAFGMLTTCYHRKIPVPERFAITGADNTYLSRQGPIPITSLEQPTEDMCQLAVETLLHRIRGNATSGCKSAALPCKVIIRSSSSQSSRADSL